MSTCSWSPRDARPFEAFPSQAAAPCHHATLPSCRCCSAWRLFVLPVYDHLLHSDPLSPSSPTCSQVRASRENSLPTMAGFLLSRTDCLPCSFRPFHRRERPWPEWLSLASRAGLSSLRLDRRPSFRGAVACVLRPELAEAIPCLWPNADRHCLLDQRSTFASVQLLFTPSALAAHAAGVPASCPRRASGSASYRFPRLLRSRVWLPDPRFQVSSSPSFSAPRVTTLCGKTHP